MKMKKILFLSISNASGHRQAAKAVINALEEEYKFNEAFDINFFDCLPKWCVRAIDGAYYSVIARKPSLWSNLRTNVFVKKIFLPLNFLFCFFVSLSFYFKHVRGQDISAVVCTQSFPCVCMSLLKKIKLLDAKLVAIITDYSINAYWFLDNVDEFIIPAEELRGELLDYGIKQDKIKPYGIPIDIKFYETSDKNEVHSSYNIDGTKYKVLLMGGSLGMGMLDDAILRLIKDKDLFLIAVCGRNQELYLKLKQQYQSYDNILILGYTNDIRDLMDVSDVLVSKPGGVTVAEALCKKLNMVIINPIAGQEEANKDFLVKNNLAYYAENVESLVQIIQRQKQKRSGVRGLASGVLNKSALQVADLLLNRYN